MLCCRFWCCRAGRCTGIPALPRRGNIWIEPGPGTPWVELSLSCAHTDGFDCACWIVHHRVSDGAWLFLGRSSGRLHMGPLMLIKWCEKTTASRLVLAMPGKAVDPLLSRRWDR